MKTYKIDQCCLYKIGTLNRLCEILHITDIKELQELADAADKNYKVFLKKTGDKDRVIQHAKPRLDRIHKVLTKHLSSIQAPKYLNSAIKGKSYMTNAKAHIRDDSEMTRCFTLDIQNFFASTSYKYIWNFFVYSLLCSKDISSILTKILVYKGHVPTGARTSPILSFLAYKTMFDQIDDLCQSKNLIMTCYIDDICISGQNADKHTLKKVKTIIKNHGLTVHPKKIRLYSKKQPKLVTGVALTSTGAKLPNRRRKNIHDNLIILKSTNTLPDEKLKLKIVGQLGEAGQLENVFNRKLKNLKDQGLL